MRGEEAGENNRGGPRERAKRSRRAKVVYGQITELYRNEELGEGKPVS